MNILFVASENGALPGGQAGGIGDVIRDLPPALAARGCNVTVMVPSHGFLHRTAGAARIGECRFLFRGEPQPAALYAVGPGPGANRVSQVVVDHPALQTGGSSGGPMPIYIHDPPERPFYSDANRFALFCAAVASAISNGLIESPDVVHLHDWHAALVALLARFDPAAAAVGRPRIVFSIHNLAYQGIRPLRGSRSSLEAWFPHLPYDWASVADPRWPDCINPMAVGIRAADRVHTVSPTYAEEIRRPSRAPRFYGGEGLESDLARVHQEGRLVGILNGCTYPPPAVERSSYHWLLDLIRAETLRWSGDTESVSTAQFLAFARGIDSRLRGQDPDVLLTGVGRVTEQKALMLMQPGSDGIPGLHAILEGIGPRGRLLWLGTGDSRFERFLTVTSARCDRFIFINGFSEGCARALYASGDLFLMPSSFEPCGLSQLLAMRHGQPCVVHAVGGLKDTVRDGVNGFAFDGVTIEAQVDGFVAATLDAVALKRGDSDAWRRICDNARKTRFTWAMTAQRTIDDLYI
ncbi:MAG: glycogen/starch synthase [Desulfosarcina sp.]